MVAVVDMRGRLVTSGAGMGGGLGLREGEMKGVSAIFYFAWIV